MAAMTATTRRTTSTGVMRWMIAVSDPSDRLQGRLGGVVVDEPVAEPADPAVVSRTSGSKRVTTRVRRSK